MRKFFKFSNALSTSIVPVGAVLLLAIASESSASTGTGWSAQPSWASLDRDRRGAERKIALTQDPRLSPFAPGSNNLALDVGQVFLMGDLGRFSDSIGSQLHYTYGVSDLFAFDSSLGYSDHSNGRFSMMTFLAGLRTNLSWYDKVVPYLVFGLGFYRPNYQELGGGSAPQEDSLAPVLFGVHLGPGVDLEITKQLFFGASLTFHDVFNSTRYTSAGTRVDAGGTYTSFFLHAGVTF